LIKSGLTPPKELAQIFSTTSETHLKNAPHPPLINQILKEQSFGMSPNKGMQYPE